MPVSHVVKITLRETATKEKGVVNSLNPRLRVKVKKKGRGEVRGALACPLMTSLPLCRSLGIKVKILLLGWNAKLLRLMRRLRLRVRKGARRLKLAPFLAVSSPLLPSRQLRR